MNDPLKAKWGDHLVIDPITGWKVFASECVRLPKYSGGEGLYTTAWESMKPHLGLAPYNIPYEVPVQFTYNDPTIFTFSVPPWNGTTNPLTPGIASTDTEET